MAGKLLIVTGHYLNLVFEILNVPLDVVGMLRSFNGQRHSWSCARQSNGTSGLDIRPSTARSIIQRTISEGTREMGGTCGVIARELYRKGTPRAGD